MRMISEDGASGNVKEPPLTDAQFMQALSDPFRRRYDFSLPETQRFADLALVEADLEAVLRICDRCAKMAREQTEPPTSGPGLLEWFDDLRAYGDLTFAAVVRYGRTFSTGARSGIPADWICELSSSEIAAHSYFKALRDKYIAHPVSEFELCQVFITFDPGMHIPNRLTADTGSLVTVSSDRLKQLRELAESLRSRVGRERSLIESKVLDWAQGIPVQDIIARGSDECPTPTSVSKGRKPFKG